MHIRQNLMDNLIFKTVKYFVEVLELLDEYMGIGVILLVVENKQAIFSID
jgi:hypothetical protein